MVVWKKHHHKLAHALLCGRGSPMSYSKSQQAKPLNLLILTCAKICDSIAQDSNCMSLFLIFEMMASWTLFLLHISRSRWHSLPAEKSDGSVEKATPDCFVSLQTKGWVSKINREILAQKINPKCVTSRLHLFICCF